MTLAETQRLVREALITPHHDDPAVRAAAPLVADTPGLPAAARLQIYRRAMAGTLVRALGGIHPVSRRLTGEEFFDAMAHACIRHMPSHSPDLADYGAGFATFIARFPPAATLPYLADVARLEWHWHRAFHAAAAPALDTAALAAVPADEQPGLRFLLPSSAALLESPWPVHRIWQVNQPDYRGDDQIRLDEGHTRLVIWRQNRQVLMEVLEAREWWLLQQFRNGLTLGELGAPADLPALLPHCVARGWLTAFIMNATR